MVSKREMKIKLKEKLEPNTYVEPRVYEVLQDQINFWISWLMEEIHAAYIARLEDIEEIPEMSRKVCTDDVGEGVFRCEEKFPTVKERPW